MTQRQCEKFNRSSTHPQSNSKIVELNTLVLQPTKFRDTYSYPTIQNPNYLTPPPKLPSTRRGNRGPNFLVGQTFPRLGAGYPCISITNAQIIGHFPSHLPPGGAFSNMQPPQLETKPPVFLAQKKALQICRLVKRHSFYFAPFRITGVTRNPTSTVAGKNLK